MKKVLFCVVMSAIVIATVGMFASCSKPEVKKIGCFELIEQDGKLGLKDSLGTQVLAPVYTKITENAEYGALLATNDAGATTVLVGTTAVFTDLQIDSIVPADVPDYVYVYGSNRANYLWHLGTADTFGPAAEIRLIEDIVFMNKADIDFDGKLFKNNWGAATLNHKGLAPFKYERILVIKNDQTSAILVKDLKSWKMFDQDGVSNGRMYDLSPKILEKRIKKLKFPDDVGIVVVSWKL